MNAGKKPMVKRPVCSAATNEERKSGLVRSAGSMLVALCQGCNVQAMTRVLSGPAPIAHVYLQHKCLISVHLQDFVCTPPKPKRYIIF